MTSPVFASTVASANILAADIGGTHARFLLAASDGTRLEPIDEATLAVAAHATVEDACAAFLARSPDHAIDRACLAVAGPVAGRVVELTNAPWRIDADALAARFAIAKLELCNDFEAAAAGLDDLPSDSLVALQEGRPSADAPRLLIGAGTGLGVAYIVLTAGGPRVIAGEGGHTGFAPANDEQIALLRFVAATQARVTAEHLLSGAGLVRLYAFAHRERGDLPEDVGHEGAAAVARRFEAGDPVAMHALELFATILGAVAGDHALAILATGGVYIAGGIAPRFRSALAGSALIGSFNAKSGQSALMTRMPVWLVCEPRLGLIGAARRAVG